MVDIDENLIGYCEEQNYPIYEMSEDDFIMVQDTVSFKVYKLGLILRELGKEILKNNKKDKN